MLTPAKIVFGMSSGYEKSSKQHNGCLPMLRGNISGSRYEKSALIQLTLAFSKRNIPTSSCTRRIIIVSILTLRPSILSGNHSQKMVRKTQGRDLRSGDSKTKRGEGDGLRQVGCGCWQLVKSCIQGTGLLEALQTQLT